jgi:hypothetical protein
MEELCTEERSRSSRIGCVLRVPLSPEEEIRGRSGVRTEASGLQRPATRPAVLRALEADFCVEDLGALRNADLADDEAGVVRHDPDFAVVASAERADDVTEVGGILHCGEAIV